MKKVLYNYRFNTIYSLQKINIYAYSFFATNLLIHNEINDNFSIDLDSIISHISSSLDEEVDQELQNIRSENHNAYYKIDVKFLTSVDKRYKKIAEKILNNYSLIDAKTLLNDDLDEALKHQKDIKLINLSIEKLREKIQEDLLVIMNYIDEEEQKLDKDFLKDDNVMANKLKKRYNALLLHKSVINMDNLTLELKRQKSRLSTIKKLGPLIKAYNENRESYLIKEYQIDDIMILRKNLSTILGEYIFLLTHQEFHDVRRVYQGLLANDYSFVDEFLYTYRIIMSKLWKYIITPSGKYHFDFYYLISKVDQITSETEISLMNRSNMYKYNDIGYICSVDENLFDVLNVSKFELLNLRLPQDITDECDFKVSEVDKITIEALYNCGHKQIFNDQYKVIEIR